MAPFFSSEAMSKIALQVDGLRKVYANGNIALHGISLTVPRGSFFALLGPNGAGKTTLINILADILHPGEGAITLFGRDVFQEKSWCKRQMGVVPQEVAFDPFFTVREILYTSAGYYGCRPEQVWVDELLDRLGLTDQADKNTRQLSGGMRRRLLVAQALVHRPPLVVLDEPTAGVDVELRHRLWDFMRELNRNGTTILLTTHYLAEAEELCDHVAIIDQGKLVACDSMQALMQRVAVSRLVLHYAKPIHISTTDEAALADFNPVVLNEGLELHLELRCDEPGMSSFDVAYEAARNRFGAPVDASVRQEDLEDVFVRLTGDTETDAGVNVEKGGETHV